jgi:ATP-dependent DNA helicase RecG
MSADFSKHRAFDKKYYVDLIEKEIREHGHMERKDANDLHQYKLPEWIDDKQRKIKINNLLSELRRKNRSQNNGSDSEPK